MLLLTKLSTGAYRIEEYGGGKGRIVSDDVNCNGTESRLTDCEANAVHNCIHAEDAGVICCGAPGENQPTLLYTFMFCCITVSVVT